MKRGFVIGLILCMMMTGGFSVISAKAGDKQDIAREKYYTSICLKEGDTLWNIAERYNGFSGKSTEEYVCELRQMNSLLDDTVHAGNYLTVSYYRPASVEIDFR